MRRHEREITDPAEMESILQAARVCHLALCDGDQPYLVPLSYGYADGTLYFHSATEGHKLDLLRRAPQVCFAVETEVALLPGSNACAFGLRYRSVIGEGVAEIVENAERKAAALDIIMAHYGAPGPHNYPAATLARTVVIAIAVTCLTGKRSP